MQIHNTLVFWSMVFHTIYFHVLKKRGLANFLKIINPRSQRKLAMLLSKEWLPWPASFSLGHVKFLDHKLCFFVSMSFIGCLLCFLFFASGLHKHQETVGCSLPNHNYPSWDLKLNMCFRFHSFIAMSGMLLSYQWVKHPTWYSSIFQLTYVH
jgi:hypothetical protein